ncbi:MAG: valine--tRNA ligase [Candidatus Ratteibacteria bacterium]|nr:valine--tRNA ligase [Candidatus Ratteibacteria bacterium]
MQEISTRYNPKEVENRWYTFWEEKKLFEVHNPSPKKPYCIVIPPPNITGSLHMGHALDGTLQDIIIRFKRMQGFDALWIPGCDHAGIATENVIERELAKQNINKHELGKDKLIDKIWDWKKQQEKRIIEQLKKLGCSCDWSRFAFTMDKEHSAAVEEAFARLFEDGLIYRGDYIVNWCPRCRTALSNVEVEYEDTVGELFHINYPLKDGKGQITVATTRPETMFGDTAVAVNPSDKRYKRLINKILILPLANREIPVISDERVSKSFGTGAVKVTPAHDPVDFEIGKTHKLDAPIIMDKEGKMKHVPEKYKGLDRFKCRKEVIEDLRKEGYLVKIVSHANSIGHCYRCKTVIEPYLSTQWFVDVQKLKNPAVKAVKSGKIRFIPDRWSKIYLNWMEEVKDWCISRQIWWGHTIPVSYCENCNEIILNRNIKDNSCSKCGSKKLVKETDVLDTWFSSSLWPMSTLGWPKDTEELKHFYPTSTLVTGYEIIYFWVARMIMMGLKLKGDVPFKTVYIHPIIRDKKGRKMSKSEGNVVDPLGLIDNFGTDALRMALAQLNTGAGQDIIFSLDRFEGMRNFSNKIWNASRFVIGILGDKFEPEKNIYELSLGLDEKFILRKVEELNKNISELLEDFKFGEASELIFKFFWHEFCDWYIELIKYKFKKENDSSDDSAALSETAEASRQTLFYVLDKVLRLMHPFMPFITEEIWHYLSKYDNTFSGSISVSKWPIFKIEKTQDTVVEEAVYKYEIIQAIRNLKAQWNIPFHEKLNFIIVASSRKEKEILIKEKDSIISVVNAQNIQIKEEMSVKDKFSSQVTPSGACVYLLLEDMDLTAEIVKIKEEMKKTDDVLTKIKKKLDNHDFILKAQPAAVEKCKTEKEELLKKREKLQQILKNFGGI